MDQNERKAVDELFGKLRQVDSQAPQRDAEAEAHIQQQVASLPAAPYYMAQAILVQEHALASMQSRVQELERAAAERPAGGGGFLGGLFGGGTSPAPRRPAAPPANGPIPPQYLQPNQAAAPGSPWSRPAGGGFLAGAMQTAMGVAGGMLVADAISSVFHSGTAEAVELVPEPVPEPEPEPTNADEPADDPSYDDFGGDSGGFDDTI